MNEYREYKLSVVALEDLVKDNLDDALGASIAMSDANIACCVMTSQNEYFLTKEDLIELVDNCIFSGNIETVVDFSDYDEENNMVTIKVKNNIISKLR